MKTKPHIQPGICILNHINHLKQEAFLEDVFQICKRSNKKANLAEEKMKLYGVFR